MAEVKVEFDVVEAKDFFYLNASSLSVSGPLPDLSLQMTFYDDFIRTTKLSLSGDSADAEGTVVQSVKMEFESETVRVAHGAVRFNLANAKELVRLLNDKIQAVESLSASPNLMGAK